MVLGIFFQLYSAPFSDRLQQQVILGVICTERSFGLFVTRIQWALMATGSKYDIVICKLFVKWSRALHTKNSNCRIFAAVGRTSRPPMLKQKLN